MRTRIIAIIGAIVLEVLVWAGVIYVTIGLWRALRAAGLG